MSKSSKSLSLPVWLRWGLPTAFVLLSVGILLWLFLRPCTPAAGPAFSTPNTRETTALATTTTTIPTAESGTQLTTEVTAAVTEAPPLVHKELTFSSPTATRFTTCESSVAIMGSADPQGTVTVNGTPVALSAIGSFAVDVSLQPGENTITFISGEKTVIYTVTYEVDVLRSITPQENQTLSGGGGIQFQAVAHRNATVKVTFAGKTLSMSPVGITNGQSEEETGDYRTYWATFTLPESTAEKTTHLGAATVTATLNGLTDTAKTGTISLSPRPSTRFITVTRDYAETFSGEIVNDFSRPTNAYLPAGTVDRVVQYGSAGDHTYYLLGCGRWVYTEDVQTLSSMTRLPDNTLGTPTVTVTPAATTLTIPAEWKIPYNLQLLPQSYSAPTADTPQYAITAQTTEYIDITFCYSPTTPAVPDVSDSPLFSSAAWRKEQGDPVLRLTLTNKGQFYGYSVEWKENTLCFSFQHPQGSTGKTDRPLEGVRIVLDPGHGGDSIGTYGTIKHLYEKTMTLNYSLILRDKLTDLGATVVMTRTDDTSPDNPTMAGRTAYARNNYTDLLLSIHMNGSAASSAQGCSLHYFNEYSYGIATSLTDAMREVERAYGIGNRQQVCTWSPFFLTRVHDCPAVLVECGFMTNADNMSLLVDETYTDRLTDAIVQGITAYFQSLPLFTVEVTTSTTSGSEPTVTALVTTGEIEPTQATAATPNTTTGTTASTAHQEAEEKNTQ